MTSLYLTDDAPPLPAASGSTATALESSLLTAATSSSGSSPGSAIVADTPYGLRVDLNQHLGMDADELHTTMKQMENKERRYEPDVRFAMEYRRYIVDFICQVRARHSLFTCFSTLFLRRIRCLHHPRSAQRHASPSHPVPLARSRRLLRHTCLCAHRALSRPKRSLQVGEEFGVQRSTAHVAVLLNDRLMVVEKIAIPRNQLQLLALCCLLISTKYEEAEERVPNVSELVCFGQKRYTVQQLVELEATVLDKLKWKITEYTPLHFLGYYINKGILYNTDRREGQPLTLRVLKCMQKYVYFFAELSLQEYSFQQYSSSQLAAAIILASRRALTIEPLWRPEFETLTHFTEEQVQPSATHLWQYYLDSFPAVAKAISAKASGTVSPDTIAAVL